MRRRFFLYIVFIIFSLLSWMLLVFGRNPETIGVGFVEYAFGGLVLSFHTLYNIIFLKSRSIIRRVIYFICILLVSYWLFAFFALSTYKSFELVLGNREVNIFSNSFDGFSWLLIYLIAIYLTATVIVWEMFFRLEIRINTLTLFIKRKIKKCF